MSTVLDVLGVAAVGYAALVAVCAPLVLVGLLVDEAAHGRRRRRAARSAAVSVVVHASRGPLTLVHDGGRTWDELLAGLDREPPS